jgi:hypothetical protein
MKESFPGRIVRMTREKAEVQCMAKARPYWKWPMGVDSLVYPHIDIIGIIEEPQLISGRGQYCVPELNGVWGLCK